MVPNRSSVFAASWIGETATRSETTGLAYSMEEIPTYECYAEVIVSMQDLEDSAFDLAADISENAAEQFAKAEGLAFVSGDSQKKPEGFMTNSNISSDLCAGALDAPSIVKFVYNLKSGYAQNAVLMMNRKTMGVVRGTPKTSRTGSSGSRTTKLAPRRRSWASRLWKCRIWTTLGPPNSLSPLATSGVATTSWTVSTCRCSGSKRSTPNRAKWRSCSVSAWVGKWYCRRRFASSSPTTRRPTGTKGAGIFRYPCPVSRRTTMDIEEYVAALDEFAAGLDMALERINGFKSVHPLTDGTDSRAVSLQSGAGEAWMVSSLYATICGSWPRTPPRSWDRGRARASRCCG